MKLLTQDTLNQFYSNLFIPVASQLHFDYFDTNLDFIGSEDMMAPGGALSLPGTMGTLQYGDISSLLQGILQKSFTGYSDPVNSKNEFDKDMKRLLEISEYIALGGVNGVVNLMVNSFMGQFVSYLKINFASMLMSFDTTDFF